MAVGVGVIVVLASSYVKYIPGNLTEVAQKVLNLLPPSIFALFVFALFVRRITTVGVWIGTLSGAAAAATIAFSGPLVSWLATRFGVDPGVFGVELITETDTATGQSWQTVADPISFQWMSIVSLLVTIGVGVLVSRMFGGKRGGTRRN